MKKNLVLLTGIVFLISILVAGGCSKGQPIVLENVEIIKDSAKVKIYLKDTLIDGKMHLRMYDSNNPKSRVTDTLHTWVVPGMKVIWKLDPKSGIKKIQKIESGKEGAKYYKIEAKKRFLSKSFKFDIPDDATRGEEEKYDIYFLDKDKDPHSIDPYLRIPPQSGGS